MVRWLTLILAFVVTSQPLPLLAKECDALRSTFKKWIAAYAKRDLDATMSIFTDDVKFSFQGAPDAKKRDLEKSYRQKFAQADQSRRWIPKFEEIDCSGRIGFVRSTWQLEVTGADGKKEIKAENRSVDILRLTEDGSWKIYQSLNYPVTAPKS